MKWHMAWVTAAASQVPRKRTSTHKGRPERWGRKIQFKVVWARTWMLLDDFRGDRAIEGAENFIVETFGREEWEKEAQASGFQLINVN
jgi:hypothetical protein